MIEERNTPYRETKECRGPKRFPGGKKKQRLPIATEDATYVNFLITQGHT